MGRIKLRNGGKRYKALLGADGAVMAAATLASAAMTTAATITAAKQQSKAAIDNAKTQAKALDEQNENNNNLQKEQFSFTTQQNKENRQQQQDIQLTLQTLAGKSNFNEILDQNKKTFKYGGKTKRRKLKSTPFYGEANNLFKVTDGGGVIPIQIDQNGYGLYELYGNDHEHYHKAPGGKNKTGVGIKFADGSIVEGEGNQNTNQGEYMLITPKNILYNMPKFNVKAKNGFKGLTDNFDVKFISKHSIKGFNPAKAVNIGMNPEEAFYIQENIKDIYGIKDDGSKAKCGKRKTLKRIMGGITPAIDQANMTQNPNNGTVSTASGVVYSVNNQINSPVESLQYDNIAKYDNRIHLKCGGRKKAVNGIFSPIARPIKVNLPNTLNGISQFLYTGPTKTSNTRSSIFDSDYAGSIYNAAGNLIGAGITALGNNYASRKIQQANNEAANIIVDAYSRMKGIDLNEIKRSDYEASHALAAIRDPNTNINPQLERIRRNATAERREINRGTLSSAVRQQRLAGINDRMMQRMSEQYAYKENADEQIKQGNVERITQTAQANADRDVQANQNYTNQRLSAMQYNNNIENTKIAGIAQAKADVINNNGQLQGQNIANIANSFSNAFLNSASGFASTADVINQNRRNYNNIMIGQDIDNQVYAAIQRNDKISMRNLIKRLELYPNNKKAREYISMLEIALS